MEIFQDLIIDTLNDTLLTQHEVADKIIPINTPFLKRVITRQAIVYLLDSMVEERKIEAIQMHCMTPNEMFTRGITISPKIRTLLQKKGEAKGYRRNQNTI